MKTEDYNRIAKAIEYISEHQKEQPSLDTIAEFVHMSPSYFQRMFTEWAGVSPKKFLQFLTVGYAKSILQNKDITLFDTTEELGLSGTGRLHDLFVNIEGMTPGEYKNGGQDLHIKYSLGESGFGNYIVASTGKGICNLHFYEDEKNAELLIRDHWTNAMIEQGSDEDQEKIHRFFNHDLEDLNKIKLHLKGTDFQIKVWESLLKIPEGNLSTYGKIASEINLPKASRAVGTAIGSNPVGFIIPCHRVIRNSGIIGEYRWGSTRKKAMIGWEAGRRL